MSEVKTLSQEEIEEAERAMRMPACAFCCVVNEKADINCILKENTKCKFDSDPWRMFKCEGYRNSETDPI